MLTIGNLGKATGVKVPTIRYYEQIGLLPPPIRSDGNQRLYDDRARERLAFVRHARDLGFPLEAIRELLPIEHWFVLSSLLAPVGYVLQDAVADAMTVEAVPRVDAEGADAPIHQGANVGRLEVVGPDGFDAGPPDLVFCEGQLHAEDLARVGEAVYMAFQAEDRGNPSDVISSDALENTAAEMERV